MSATNKKKSKVKLNSKKGDCQECGVSGEYKLTNGAVSVTLCESCCKERIFEIVQCNPKIPVVFFNGDNDPINELIHILVS
jgi:hypothetical protein